MADAQRRILIVGRDEHDAKKLAHILQHSNYEVAVSDDQYGAVKTANEGAVDMIIAEHDREYIDGIELLRRLKQANSDVKVIMLSRLLDMDTYLNVMNQGCDDCLEKSCDREEVLRVVECVLKRRVETQSGVN